MKPVRPTMNYDSRLRQASGVSRSDFDTALPEIDFSRVDRRVLQHSQRDLARVLKLLEQDPKNLRRRNPDFQLSERDQILFRYAIEEIRVGGQDASARLSARVRGFDQSRKNQKGKTTRSRSR
jgi:hypothetical protein